MHVCLRAALYTPLYAYHICNLPHIVHPIEPTTMCIIVRAFATFYTPYSIFCWTFYTRVTRAQGGTLTHTYTHTQTYTHISLWLRLLAFLTEWSFSFFLHLIFRLLIFCLLNYLFICPNEKINKVIHSFKKLNSH